MASPADIENHLELGKDFLARGQLSDALTHYHAAVGKYKKKLKHFLYPGICPGNDVLAYVLAFDYI